jgi:c-di-GMP-binding flagellar brake protein YcgR
MTGVPGVDFPEGGLVDLLLASRGDALIGWVESANDDMIVVTAGEDRSRRRVRIEAGEHVNVVWRAPEELRSRPTELVAVELEPHPVWRLRTAGPAARGQRRAWVRAPLAFPVWMSAGSAELGGMTVDISEGGARVLFNGSADTAAEKSPLDNTGTGWRAPPEDASAVAPAQAVEESENTGPFTVGTVVDLTLWPDEEGLECRAELLRRIPREDDRLEFTLRFIGIHEKTQDVIRRYVFTGLRQLRARGLI